MLNVIVITVIVVLAYYASVMSTKNNKLKEEIVNNSCRHAEDMEACENGCSASVYDLQEVIDDLEGRLRMNDVTIKELERQKFMLEQEVMMYTGQIKAYTESVIEHEPDIGQFGTKPEPIDPEGRI